MSDAAREMVLALWSSRAPEATVCPSEVARAIAGPDWRAAMAAVHASIGRLLAEQIVALSWKGQPLATRSGPYRIGLKRIDAGEPPSPA